MCGVLLLHKIHLDFCGLIIPYHPKCINLALFACCLFEGKLELAGGVNGARETGKQGIVGPTMRNWTSRRGREVQSACWWQRPQTVSKDNSLGSPQPPTFMLTQKISGIAGGATPSRAKK